jgi:hypothetical protein
MHEHYLKKGFNGAAYVFQTVIVSHHINSRINSRIKEDAAFEVEGLEFEPPNIFKAFKPWITGVVLQHSNFKGMLETPVKSTQPGFWGKESSISSGSMANPVY